MRVNGLLAVVVLAIGLCGTALAQDAPPQGAPGPGTGRGGNRMFNGVGGEITAIEGSTITLHTFRGTTEKVLVTSSTRFAKDGNEMKLSDFKVGDRVFVAGEQGKDGVWTAQILGQRAGGFQRGGMMGGTPLKPEDNGKTYIAGELLKIDGTKLTVKKPDNTEQVIEVDDDTSFRNGRDSVTLADMKPGDFVRGQGAVKDGVFVPKVLNSGRPRGMHPGAGMAPPPAGAQLNPNPSAPVTGDEKK
jgi:hypothetical protein